MSTVEWNSECQSCAHRDPWRRGKQCFPSRRILQAVFVKAIYVPVSLAEIETDTFKTKEGAYNFSQWAQCFR